MTPKQRQGRRGSVAAIAGVVLVPLTLLVGLAVDYARLTAVRSELQQAVDAAALAGARVVVGSPPNDAVVKEDARRFFWANFRSGRLGARIDSDEPAVTVIEPQRNQVQVRATAEVPVIIAGAVASLLRGGPTMASSFFIAADATVQKYQRGMEVALALDTTASMATGSRLAQLKTAAGDLLEILYGFGNDTRSSIECNTVSGGARVCSTVYSLLVGVVPFVATVNVTPVRDNGPLPKIVAPETVTALTWSNPASMQNYWKGCVMARPYPYEESFADATPLESPFMPYFWASTPSTVVWGGVTYTGPNPWVGTKETWPDWPSPSNPNNRNNVGWGAGQPAPGPNLGCGFPLLPLQPSKAVAKTHINALDVGAQNGTTVSLGFSWGWRLLSPKWRSWWEGGNWTIYSGTSEVSASTPVGSPRDYDSGTEKVIVLFTDGQNEMGDGTLNSVQSCCTNAYGDWATRPLGTNPVSVLNARTVEVCQAIKASGVRIFVVLLFPSPPPSVLNTFNENGCASGPEYFFNTPTASDLQAIFRQIGAQLTNLRLVD
jgi:Flp pilus assembly protein TadG